MIIIIIIIIIITHRRGRSPVVNHEPIIIRVPTMAMNPYQNASQGSLGQSSLESLLESLPECLTAFPGTVQPGAQIWRLESSKKKKNPKDFAKVAVSLIPFAKNRL